MAAKDIISGSVVTRNDRGTFAERVFVVDGLSGAAESRLLAALSDPDVPAHRSPHPSIPGMLVSSTTVETIPGTNAHAKVTLNYTTEIDPTTSFTEWTFEISWRRSFRDAQQAFLETQAETSPGVFSAVQRHSNWVIDYVGNARVTVERAPVGSTKLLQDTFASTVNNSTFSGYAFGVVLCKGFESTSNRDGTERIVCNYAVAPASRPEKWGVTVRHVSAGFWLVGEDATISEVTYERYPFADFSTMTPSFLIT